MQKYIAVIGIIITTFGTILSLWTILSTKVSDMGTAAKHDNQQNDFKKEKKIVIVGSFLIVIGSAMQIISILI